MGKGRPRAVEKGVLGGQSSSVSSTGPLNIPDAPVYYPNEEEFEDPLEYIYKIRPEAEAYGICRIVPPKSWKPPFALDLESFTFPTKTQAIHQLQLRPAACDSKTFELEYGRFLEEHCGKKSWKKVVFEGQDLDLCKLFNAVKRYGGYDKVVKEKKWGEVFRFVMSARKIPECAKHVLCQLYREHLYDYESYYNRLNEERARKCKRRIHEEKQSNDGCDFQSSKRRRRHTGSERAKECKEEKKDDRDQICEQCKSGSHGEVMLLCDRCNKGWHIYCLSPPLKEVPPGNWYCLQCLSSDKDSFGFVPGKCFSLESFRRMADRAKKKWFGSSPVSRVQIEKKFWEIVEGTVGEVEVMYGSDLDTSVHGSGFPRSSDERPQSVEAGVWDRYCVSPWNLNNLPKLRGSMLRAVHQSIAGVMVPWMYIGMLFSSFCWHFEDHCFYSMNYLHWGEPKYWYSVPGKEAYAFEKVMRNCLPDLFDAQPDLLFQLITMLNPSVLQENDVPVYSILQEPGNFVITFPRSYHGGFNLGLNCAEAVNFAPADWLPHGGIGAGLYQLYHKPAVLSHEELLCVVAKSDYDSKVTPYLKKELIRIYEKEKVWRERLWRSGFVNSSLMSPRKNVDYVGTEEDPTCIICHQYLYLSAVVCRCRPSAFACLEHWEHICECKPSKRRLLYRHTLAELSDMVLLADKFDFEKTPQNRKLRKQIPYSNDSAALTKKVKAGHVSLVELAEEWILRSCNIFQMPFTSDAFVNALKEAEQFLWAGSEMDLVRDITKNLIEAKNWAEGVRVCVAKVENWSCDRCPHSEKVQFEYLDKLMSLNPVPCNEPGHLKLKGYLEETRLLIKEIDSSLSSCSEIPELEILHNRACDLPILLEESEKLGQRISSAKVCRDNVRSCIVEKCPAAIELDILYKLKKEVLGLLVHLPETEMLLDLLSQAETRRAQCCEVLEGPMHLKKVERFLQELDGFTVNFQELKLLRQYYGDTVSWISRLNDVIVNVHDRKDQENVVNELNCLLKDAASLRIQVDELPNVEVELKKASCREKAQKILNACDGRKSIDFIQHLMMEALTLEIDGEKLFIDISGVLAAVVHWEERATKVLVSESQMSDFEDIIRASESICVILPSFNDVKEAVSMAKSWLEKSKPFLASGFSTAPASSSLLKVEDLKDLESQSKLLKVSLTERKMLQTVLQNCRDWEHKAFSLLENAAGLFELCDIDKELANGLVLNIEHLLTDVDSVVKAGLSLGLDFIEIPKLHNVYYSLEWCYKALSLCSDFPSLQEVERLLEAAEHLPVTCMSSPLLSSLIDGFKWLRRASELISGPCGSIKCELTSAEEVNGESQTLKISFPWMADQLVNAIGKHKLWLEQANVFFSLKPGDRSYPWLIQLKDIGISDAFDCPERNVVISEVERVEKWKLQCKGIVAPLVVDVNSLHSTLLEIKHTLDRSLSIYEKSKEYKASGLCVFCSSDCDDHDCLACSNCKECYHLRCLGPLLVGANDEKGYKCPYCQFIGSGSVARNGGGLLISKGKRHELKIFSELLSDAEDFCVRLEEKVVLEKIVEQTLACRACLTGIVDFALAYQDKDIDIISGKLSTALKALGVAGVYDHQAYSNLETALTRNSWKVRVHKVTQSSQKPSIHQIQRLLKEGEAMHVPIEDYFRQKLTALKSIGMQWADTAKKVAIDSGALELDEVFELIKEGENLPVHFEKELKLLRTRSMLYCICRKPYDQRAMIACDQCDEWYHFDCIKLSSAPKIYFCPACRPRTEELSTSPLENEERSTVANGGPQTPSPRGGETRRKLKKAMPGLEQIVSVPTDDGNISRHSSGINLLLWRNQKPFRRAAKKRVELENLFPLCNKQQ